MYGLSLQGVSFKARSALPHLDMLLRFPLQALHGAIEDLSCYNIITDDLFAPYL